MDATPYKFKTFPWPPPDDRKDPRFYLFGFDADNQPYIVRWSNHARWQGWRAISLDDRPHDSAEPITCALVEENADRIRSWADAPLRWSTLGHGPDNPPSGGEDV